LACSIDVNLSLNVRAAALSWSIADYEKESRGLRKSEWRTLDTKFPPLAGSRPDGSEILVRAPTVVLDKHGVIVWWYLPGILQKKRQVCTCRP
jgi:hypothetical protein